MPEPDGGSARDRPNENGPRRRSNEDGARRRRRRNRNRPRDRPRSRISELSENVLDVPRGNAESYVTNMREIAGYIARTVPNGGEFVTALDPDDLGFAELVEPTDPQANATNIEIKKWELKLKDYEFNRKAREKASETAFAILLAQCSDQMLSEMETYHNWPAIKSGMDVILLAQLIRTIMYTGTQTQSVAVSYVEAEMSLLGFQQRPNMSNRKYFDTFKAKVEVYKQLGGQPGLNEGRLTDQLIEDGYDPDTATIAQKTEAKKSIAEQHLAIIFLKNADKARYGGLVADLANRQARECDEYPRNLAKAFDMLTTWDRVTPSSQNATTNDQGLAYWTEDQSRNPGSRGRGRTGGRGGRGRPSGNYPGRGRGNGRGNQNQTRRRQDIEDEDQDPAETHHGEDYQGDEESIFEPEHDGHNHNDNDNNETNQRRYTPCAPCRRIAG